jgi:hypothetical protein
MKKIVKSHVFTEEERKKILLVANDDGATGEDVQKGIDWLKKTSEFRKKKEKEEKGENAPDKIEDDQTQQDLDLVKKVLGDKAAKGLEQAILMGDDDEYNRLVQTAEQEIKP